MPKEAERRDLYIEYQGVCPFAPPSHLDPGGGVGGEGGANSDERPEPLALCILCGKQREGIGSIASILITGRTASGQSAWILNE